MILKLIYCCVIPVSYNVIYLSKNTYSKENSIDFKSKSSFNLLKPYLPLPILKYYIIFHPIIVF